MSKKARPQSEDMQLMVETLRDAMNITPSYFLGLRYIRIEIMYDYIINSRYSFRAKVYTILQLA